MVEFGCWNNRFTQFIQNNICTIDLSHNCPCLQSIICRTGHIKVVWNVQHTIEDGKTAPFHQCQGLYCTWYFHNWWPWCRGPAEGDLHHWLCNDIHSLHDLCMGLVLIARINIQQCQGTACCDDCASIHNCLHKAKPVRDAYVSCSDYKAYGWLFIHSLIFHNCLSLSGSWGVGADHSWHWVRDRVHPRQVL